MSERLRNAAIFTGTAFLLYEASKSAFNIGTRKEIGRDQHWTCQGVDGRDCILNNTQGKSAKWSDGFMITVAHYPSLHGKHNDDPSAGRCLCQMCHAIEEIKRGNEWGADKLLKMGIYNKYKEKEMGHNIYPTVDRIKGVMLDYGY